MDKRFDSIPTDRQTDRQKSHVNVSHHLLADARQTHYWKNQVVEIRDLKCTVVR